jgi:hypothetical protein
LLICPKNYFLTKFEYGYQNNPELIADFETGEKCGKFANKKVLGLFHITNFLANNFLCALFQLFPRI